MNALKENRIQVFRLAFTYGPVVTVTLVTRPVVPVCRHLTAEWLLVWGTVSVSTDLVWGLGSFLGD